MYVHWLLMFLFHVTCLCHWPVPQSLGALVSWGYWYILPQNGWVKTTEMYPFIIWRPESKIKVSAWSHSLQRL